MTSNPWSSFKQTYPLPGPPVMDTVLPEKEKKNHPIGALPEEAQREMFTKNQKWSPSLRINEERYAWVSEKAPVKIANKACYVAVYEINMMDTMARCARLTSKHTMEVTGVPLKINILIPMTYLTFVKVPKTREENKDVYDLYHYVHQDTVPHTPGYIIKSVLLSHSGLYMDPTVRVHGLANTGADGKQDLPKIPTNKQDVDIATAELRMQYMNRLKEMNEQALSGGKKPAACAKQTSPNAEIEALITKCTAYAEASYSGSVPIGNAVATNTTLKATDATAKLFEKTQVMPYDPNHAKPEVQKKQYREFVTMMNLDPLPFTDKKFKLPDFVIDTTAVHGTIPSIARVECKNEVVIIFSAKLELFEKYAVTMARGYKAAAWLLEKCFAAQGANVKVSTMLMVYGPDTITAYRMTKSAVTKEIQSYLDELYRKHAEAKKRYPEAPTTTTTKTESMGYMSLHS